MPIGKTPLSLIHSWLDDPKRTSPCCNKRRCSVDVSGKIYRYHDNHNQIYRNLS